VTTVIIEGEHAT